MVPTLILEWHLLMKMMSIYDKVEKDGRGMTRDFIPASTVRGLYS